MDGLFRERIVAVLCRRKCEPEHTQDHIYLRLYCKIFATFTLRDCQKAEGKLVEMKDVTQASDPRP
jgi:hypothetical protein